MKKSVFMIIAILTVGCTACLAGCAKNPDSDTTVYHGAERRIALTDDTPDDNEPETPDGDNAPDDNAHDRECPDGNCGNKGPHTGKGKRRKLPINESFHFTIEFGPRGGRGKRCPSHENPDAPEVLPAPDNGENN